MKNKLATTISLLSIFTLVCCSKGHPTPSVVTFSFDDKINTNIHTEDQKTFIEADDPDSLVGSSAYSGKIVEGSKPLPITLLWGEQNDVNAPADKYEINVKEVGNDNRFLDEYTLTSNSNSVDIYNLKINTTYEFEVTSYHNDETFKGSSSFVTSCDAPRNIYVEGVENVRDLGGWTLENGKTYKQGMIYRTAQFNYGGDKNTYVSAPSEEGLNVLLDDLHIKTEIDLRRTIDFANYDEVNSITSSPLGDNVNYVSAPMQYGGANIFTLNKNHDSIKLFFNTLADINNYPIAFHCLRGTDRTGALAYMIGALCGMNEDDLMLDYLFSNLANINGMVTASNIDKNGFYVVGIRNSDGDTISEKAKNYLMNKCGVSEDIIDAVIDILTE